MDSIKEIIEDIVDAGILEIEIAFIDLENKISIINTKSYILELLVMRNIELAEIVNILEKQRVSPKIKEELINYAHTIYKCL